MRHSFPNLEEGGRGFNSTEPCMEEERETLPQYQGFLPCLLGPHPSQFPAIDNCLPPLSDDRAGGDRILTEQTGDQGRSRLRAPAQRSQGIRIVL